MASSEASGQAAISAFRAASFMAKARQVLEPHSLQLVLGSSFCICSPVSAILQLPVSMRSEMTRRVAATASGW